MNLQTLNSIYLLLAIIISGSTILNFLLIRPLTRSIISLKESIDKVETKLDYLSQSNKILEIKDAEKQVKIQELEKRLFRIESKKWNDGLKIY